MERVPLFFCFLSDLDTRRGARTHDPEIKRSGALPAKPGRCPQIGTLVRGGEATLVGREPRCYRF